MAELAQLAHVLRRNPMIPRAGEGIEGERTVPERSKLLDICGRDAVIPRAEKVVAAQPRQTFSAELPHKLRRHAVIDERDERVDPAHPVAETSHLAKRLE